MRSLKGALLIALAALGGVLSAAPVGGQNVELKSESDPNLSALITEQHALQGYGSGPDLFEYYNQLTSPDADALEELDHAAANSASVLRATADLLGLYDNMHCASDRAMMKPLLQDRLRMYSRLLDVNAQSAALPLRLATPGAVKLEATKKKALQLRDHLRAAKNRLDTVVASLD